MDLFPAIDLRQGVAVRLAQGDFDRQRTYGDPLAVARRYEAAGARWIHVVDLDAARSGTAANRREVLALAGAVGIPVQAGGGVRSAADAEELLSGGVARVVLGTAALREPSLVEALADRFPGRVAVGLDHRAGPAGREVAVEGWVRRSGTALVDALGRLQGVPIAAVVVTAIERDGALEGPDLPGLAQVLAESTHPVIASGGVRSTDDLRALGLVAAGGRRLSGVVVGRALLDGTLSIEEALAACMPSA